MREHVRAFVEITARALPLRGPVYEFGSYLVAGQERLADLRPLFPGRRYVGCDMRPGPGVDRVEDLAELRLPDGAAQTILCLETLEHTFDVPRAVAEMLRVLAPGGTIVVSTPLDFRIHAFPDDYWRLTPSCLARLLAPCAAALVGWQGVESFPHTVLGIGCQGPVEPDTAACLDRVAAEYRAWLAKQSRALPRRERLKRALVGWTRSKGERRRWRDEHTAGFTIRGPGAAGDSFGRLSVQRTLASSPVPSPAGRGLG
jgi:SAM-dependent methyltransferase